MFSMFDNMHNMKTSVFGVFRRRETKVENPFVIAGKLGGTAEAKLVPNPRSEVIKVDRRRNKSCFSFF